MAPTRENPVAHTPTPNPPLVVAHPARRAPRPSSRSAGHHRHQRRWRAPRLRGRPRPTPGITTGHQCAEQRSSAVTRVAHHRHFGNRQRPAGDSTTTRVDQDGTTSRVRQYRSTNSSTRTTVHAHRHTYAHDPPQPNTHSDSADQHQPRAGRRGRPGQRRKRTGHDTTVVQRAPRRLDTHGAARPALPQRGILRPHRIRCRRHLHSIPRQRAEVDLAMVNETLSTDPLHVSALRQLQDAAPHCSHDYGPPDTDQDPATGNSPHCPECDKLHETRLNLLRNLQNPGQSNTAHDVPLAVTPENRSRARTVELTPIRPEDNGPPPDDRTPTVRINRAQITPAPRPGSEEARQPENHRTELLGEPERHPADPAGAPSDFRGTHPDGTIRTTGWLQLGNRPISSGTWAALAGATIGLSALDTLGWWGIALPLAGYTVWHAATQWIWPSSTAVNQGRVRADELTAGTMIRIHGPIGPVGIVDKTTPASLNQTLVRFVGGTQRFLPDHVHCHVVELRD